MLRRFLHLPPSFLSQDTTRFSSAAAAAASPSSSSNTTSSAPSIKLNLPQMENLLRRQFGPNAQLLVREQALPRHQRHHGQRKRARRLDNETADDEAAAASSSETSLSAAGEEEEQEAVNKQKYRSSVTFRQCGFNVTLFTAESERDAEDALRLAFNGAVATDIRFFNPTLRQFDAAVFDRVRFLALGLGKMIRFSIGGGGENLTKKDALATEEEKNGAADEMEEEDDDSVIFTCTAYIKDDWNIGRSRDQVLLTTAGKTARAAFSAAVHAARDMLTRETEEGHHSLEDVRELQRALDEQEQHFFESADNFDAVLFPWLTGKSSPSSSLNNSISSSSSSGGKKRKLVHPELTTGKNPKNPNQQNYTAKLTITDNSSSGSSNSYTVKSGDANRTALAAFRSCVLQVLKRESFVSASPCFFSFSPQSTTSSSVSSSAAAAALPPQALMHILNRNGSAPYVASKTFFTQIQWTVEHLAWHSGLARNLSWDLHFRSTMRSSFAAARQQRQQQQHKKGHQPEIVVPSTDSPSSSSTGPVYLHATLHVGPVELSFADGVGKYRTMLNCYCNALERLLGSCPPVFARQLAIPSVPALYALYTETDRFQPTDALKGNIKGLNPLTTLGAVCNLHFGCYYQQQWEALESQSGIIKSNQLLQQKQSHHQQQQQQSSQMPTGAVEEAVYIVVPTPTGTLVAIAEATTIKPGTKGQTITRALAAKLACTWALRDNFPLIYAQVKDRADFKGAGERDQQLKLQRLKSLPREKRLSHFDTILSLLRDFGGEDHGWADVDVDCVSKGGGHSSSSSSSLAGTGTGSLWIATCFARIKKDGTTRDLMVSKPSTTKTECRKRVLLAAAHRFFPTELQQWLAVREQAANQSGAVPEFSKADMAAVLGSDAASAIRPFDPVSGGSLQEQMLAILAERQDKIVGLDSSSCSSSSSSSSSGQQQNHELRVWAEMCVENPFPVTKPHGITSSSSASSSYRCKILTSSAIDSARYVAEVPSENKSSNNSGGGGGFISQQQKYQSLFQTIRDGFFSAAATLQLDTERLRLLIASFEDHRATHIFRPQDLAEWLLKSNVGCTSSLLADSGDAVKVEVNLSHNLWCAALAVRFPLLECAWPGSSDLLSSSSSSSSSSSPRKQQQHRSTPRVYEWVELSRAIATTKKEATKMCYIKAARSNCFAHLTYLSRKSLEQQQDADAVLNYDVEQFDSLLQPSEREGFFGLSPSPVAVLRSALRADGNRLRVDMTPLSVDEAMQQHQQSSTTEQHTNSSVTIGNVVDGDVPMFECILYRKSAGDEKEKEKNNMSVIARARGANPEDALNDAVKSALDQLLPDADLRHFESKWQLEIPSSSSSSVEGAEDEEKK